MVDFGSVQSKWQKKWDESKIFRSSEDSKKKKFYCLEMFPYPSASFLHMGHVRNYSMGDAIARFKRMTGFNVLYPMGYDAFGLPAENAAIKDCTHPKKYTDSAIMNITKLMKELGLSYDWDRTLSTHLPEYYRWNQWFFLQFLKEGLAYRKKAPVNWCTSCNTVLANEEVEDGKCWRCKSEVEVRPLEQWFLRSTKYADELLHCLDGLGWSDRLKKMQENWIGKSKGTLVDFKLKDSKEIVQIFTTRPDTLFGVTFITFAPEHPKVMELVKGTEYETPVRDFIKKVVIDEKFSRTDESAEKEGMFIGKYVINPVTKQEVPIYIGNFVLLEYGTGAVMAVPAHDQRDFEFAKKYGIPIKVVISPEEYTLDPVKMSRAYVEEGTLVNSGSFDGLHNLEAIDEITKHLEKNKLGCETVQYKLRDWLISRQRYWGTPFPIVYCDKCGVVPVPESELPVKLPEDVVFSSKENVLAKLDSFVNTKCPKCGGKGRRETDTMATFVDSAWYYLRYCSPHYHKGPFDPKAVKYWMPVDQYVGGTEHAVGHLIYARFFTKALRDLGILEFDEPFRNLFNQGIVYKDGHKMSKSFGNVITQAEISSKYGIDTARVFLLFVASPDKEIEWSDEGIEGSFRFVKKFYSLFEDAHESVDSIKDKIVLSKVHSAVKSVTESIDSFKLNNAIITIMDLVSVISKHREHLGKAAHEEALEKLCLIASPFIPHTAEECWELLGKEPFVSVHAWPKPDETKIDARAEFLESVFDSTIADVRNVLGLVKIASPKKVSLFVADDWKYLFFLKLKEEIGKTRDPGSVLKIFMQDVKFRAHGKEISSLVPKVLKDTSKIPVVVLDSKHEFDFLKSCSALLEKELGCQVDIQLEAKTDLAKARQAMPGKPAILVE